MREFISNMLNSEVFKISETDKPPLKEKKHHNNININYMVLQKQDFDLQQVCLDPVIL